MPARKQLTLSIVIPVYNEQAYIGACLEAIARQTDLPDEVLVIDNNTTDKTVNIAESFPFVTIIHEPLQHQSFAQKRGFDAACGDIIGRIDGDTILHKDWVANVKKAFAVDPRLVAVTGDGEPYDVFSRGPGRAGFGFYNWLISRLVGQRMLWGANCAVRRSSWSKVNNKVLLRNDIWEDYDLSFCLRPYGEIRSLPGMTVGISYRAVQKSFVSQFRYQFRLIRTLYLRTNLLTTVVTFVLWSTAILTFPFLMLDHHLLKPLARARGRRFTPKAYLNSLD